MTRMTGPDCAAMCDLINIHTHTQSRKNKSYLYERELNSNGCQGKLFGIMFRVGLMGTAQTH